MSQNMKKYDGRDDGRKNMKGRVLMEVIDTGIAVAGMFAMIVKRRG